MVMAFILACEAFFWILLLGGLAARYLLRRRTLSTVLLLLVPVLDAVLLAAIALHLASGAQADASHGLGTLYLGFTVAWGHPVIRLADARFAHRFAGGPPPPKPPKAGLPGVRREAVAWLRTTVACAIGAGVLGGLVLATGDPERTRALGGFFVPLGFVMFWNTVIGVWGVVAALTARDRSGGADRADGADHADRADGGNGGHGGVGGSDDDDGDDGAETGARDRADGDGNGDDAVDGSPQAGPAARAEAEAEAEAGPPDARTGTASKGDAAVTASATSATTAPKALAPKALAPKALGDFEAVPARKAAPEGARRPVTSSWEFWVGAVLATVGGVSLASHLIGALAAEGPAGPLPVSGLLQVAAGAVLLAWSLRRRLRRRLR